MSTETLDERIAKMSRTIQTKNEEIAQLQGSLDGAVARAGEADRQAREARDALASARRDAAAASTLRVDLQRAREDLTEARHQLKVARELAPPDESQIVAALREAYDAKEAELREELREVQADLAALRDEHGELESTAEERRDWANLTQGELDEVAEALGLPKDGKHGAVAVAVAGLLRRLELAEHQGAIAREAAAAVDGRLEEARRAGGGDPAEAPTEGVRERLNALATIALKLGLRRNAKPDVILEAFIRAELTAHEAGMQASVGPGEATAVERLERLLVALWPDRNVHDAETTPTLESVPDAVERIEELRDMADEWADGGRPAGPATDLMQRLFDALLARVEAGEADTDMLDRLERLAKETT